MKNRIIVAAVAAVVIFLVGFVPQYLKANRLDRELRESQHQNAGARLRDLIGLAYVQANQKNFGLAAETTARFFTQARQVAENSPDAGNRKALEELLTPRDTVTAELAKGDPAVMGPLQELFTKTFHATTNGGTP